MTKRSYYLLIILLSSWGYGLAQSSDLQLRAGISVTKNLKKGFDWTLQHQSSFVQNASEFKTAYYTFQLGYKINKNLNAAIECRFATTKVYDKFRWAAALNQQWKFKNTTLAWRSKLLYEHYLQAIPELNQFNSTFNLRERLQLSKKVNAKSNVFVNVEPVFELSNDEILLKQVRQNIGLSYELNKRNSLEITYGIFNKYNSNNLANNYRVGLNYIYELPKSKSKKKNEK